MMLSYLFLSLIIFLAIAWLIWRYSSRRHSLPCPSWLAKCVEVDNPFTKIAQAATILKNSEIEAGMKVLDAGCGPGRITIPAAKKVGIEGQVFAMDIQKGMIENVQKKAILSNLNNIIFLNAGLGEFKLAKDQFDRILMVSVLGEIPDQNRAIQEIYQALKSNGIFSITETIFDPHYQRMNSVIKLSEKFGFQEKERFRDLFSYTLNFIKKNPILKKESD